MTALTVEYPLDRMELGEVQELAWSDQGGDHPGQAPDVRQPQSTKSLRKEKDNKGELSGYRYFVEVRREPDHVAGEPNLWLTFRRIYGDRASLFRAILACISHPNKLPGQRLAQRVIRRAPAIVTRGRKSSLKVDRCSPTIYQDAYRIQTLRVGVDRLPRLGR